MTITAQWANAEQTSIIVDIDGVKHGVPNNPGNRHRQMLAEWESEGNTIAPYVAPPVKTNTEIDQEALNEALVAPGSVTRALGLVMFAEINKLRVKSGDPAYTLNQFKAALLAQMR